MKRRYCGKLMALSALLLAGCVAPPPAAVTPADAVARLRTGEPLLACREPCLAAWRLAQPQAAQLDASRRWAELAALIVSTGYQDDLSLYYLGQAAEGLGYPAAAASYYRQSTYVSGTTISCQNLSRSCGGLVFPREALRRIAAIERGLVRVRPRRAIPGPREPVQPTAVEEPPAAPAPAVEMGPPPPIEAVTGAPAALPEPPPPSVSLPPPPPPVLTRPAPTDYLEPPPASR